MVRGTGIYEGLGHVHSCYVKVLRIIQTRLFKKVSECGRLLYVFFLLMNQSIVGRGVKDGLGNNSVMHLNIVN